MISIWMRLFYKVEVLGVENFPLQGSAVLCANHTFYKDLLLLGSNVKRRVRWFAKAELFRFPVFSQLITWLGAFPVKRGKNDRGAVKTVYDLLANGEVVGIFPEGTRSKDWTKRLAAKKGFVVFALKTKTPIIPASIIYREGPFKRSQLFSGIKVIFHKPVVLDYEKVYSNEELTSTGNDIMNIIYSFQSNGGIMDWHN